MKVPFVDLSAQYAANKNKIDAAIAAVIEKTAFVGGSNNSFVNAFESEFASFLGQNHVISCANGTDSLEILLEAYGVGVGDEVIVPAISWISTSEAIGRCGAVPVFVDVCEDTLLIDINLIESKITARTKAIMPVHLYGNAVDMPSLMAITKPHNIIVIEDCAQSHGAKFNNKLVGTFGDAASFSFYPGKNLGAYGDAGCISTNNAEIAAKCRMISNHGQIKKHSHVMEGRNSRMDGIHAAVLSVKLPHLNQWNELRRKHAQNYSSLLNGSNFKPVAVNEGAESVFHLYVIRCNNRNELQKHLIDNQIECAVHYPTPLPFLEAYKSRNFKKEDYPVAARQAELILSIPMFPELTIQQIEFVVSELKQFDGQRKN